MDAKTLAKNLPGRYQLLKALGAGAMGIVYQAYDQNMKRMVAIKVLLKKDNERKSSSKRFYREMEAVARLDHPDIVKIYDLGNIGRVPYMVMECVEGGDLLQYCLQKSLSPKDKLRLIGKLALALDYAHHRKVIHRDIKPANIMVRSNGDPVVMDFGCAKITEVSDNSLTRSGEVLGTPEYMSPEQASGLRREIDSRTDVYSLGAVLYHLLAGRPPVEGDTFMETLYQLVEMRHPPLLSTIIPEMPREIENICLKAMAKDKKRRYQTASDFADDIQRYLQGDTIRAYRFHQKRQLQRFVLIPTAAIVVLLLTFWAIHRLCQSQPLSPFKQYQNYQMEAHSLAKSQKYTMAADKFQQALDSLQKSGDKNYRQHKPGLLTKMLENYHKQSLSLLASEPERVPLCLDNANKLIARFPEIGAHWQKRIQNALIKSYDNVGDYQQIYQLAQSGATPESEDSQWLVAKAAYHYEAADALARLQKLREAKSKAIPGKYDSENLYYQGMIYWRQGKIGKAETAFAAAWSSTNQKNGHHDGRFISSLALYFSACLLYDFEKRWSKEQLQKIKKHLDIASQDLATTNDYKETRARYILRVIAAEHGKQGYVSDRPASAIAQQMASEALQLIDECIHTRKGVSVYHYIRGQANYYLARYKQAMADFSIASDLNPMSLQPILAKLNVFVHYARPEDFQEYYQQLPKSALAFSDETPAPLQPEFRQWQTQYRASLFLAQNIPFSEKRFAWFCAKLFSESEEIRSLARKALLHMHPSNKVLQKLQKMQRPPEHQAILNALSQEIMQYQQQMKENDLRRQLIEVPFIGTIPPSLIEAFHNKINFLKKIFGEQGHLFLRFLAARVLVHLPSKKSREIVYDQLKSSEISTRILAARALSEIGLNYFDNRFLLKFSSKNHILTALLVETLLPTNAENQAKLHRLLKSEDIMVRVLAASRFGNQVPDEILPDWEKAIRAGHSASIPQVRALAIFSLWRAAYHVYFVKNQQAVSKWLPSLQRALEDHDPVVKRAALAMINVLGYFPTDTLKIINTIKAILQASKEPIIRYRCIVALASLGDISIIEAYALNHQHPLAERISAIMGLARLASNGQNARKNQWSTGSLTRFLKLDPDPRMAGVMILISARSIFRLGVKFQLETGFQMFKSAAAIMEIKLCQFLRHKSPFVRLCSIFASMELSKIHPRLFQCIEDRFRNDSCDHVRMLALGAIFYHGFYNKSLPLAKWQAIVKNKLHSPSPEAKKLAMAAAWGYYHHIEEDIECSAEYAHEMGWNFASVQHYRMTMFRRAVQGSKCRQRYIDALQHCLAIFSKIRDRDGKQQKWYETCIYLLASIYHFNEDSAKALLLLENACHANDWKNPDLSALWGEIIYRKNQKRKPLEKAWNQLRHALSRTSAPQSAKVLRAMAQIATLIKSEKKTMSLYQEQYYIAPDHPLALIALGDYHYRCGHYKEVCQIFEQAGYFFQIGEAYFGLAAIYTIQNNRKAANKNLSLAWRLDYFTDFRQLRKYPELDKAYSKNRIHQMLKNWESKIPRRSSRQRYQFKNY